MELIEGIKHVIDGNGILFIGAGFSINAINILGESMKLASDLSEELCDDIRMPRSKDLSRVSDIYLSERESQKN